MFNNIAIQNAFMGLVGIRSTNDPDLEDLSGVLSYDGTNILAKHPLVTHENLKALVTDYSTYDYPDYDAGTIYAIGDRVDYNQIVYESMSAGNTGNTPDVSVEWERVNLLALYLEDVMRDSITETLNEVFNTKKINRQTKTILSHQRLTYGSGTYQDPIVNQGSLVGVKVAVRNAENVVAIMERVGFQFTGPVSFNLYIYHTSQNEPIQTIPITHTNTISFQWHDVKASLEAFSEEYDSGHYYIMYDQDELGGVQALKKRHNFHTAPCSYCNRNDVMAFQAYSPFLRIHTVEVKAAQRNGVNLWNTDFNAYVLDNNYGMNFEFSARCDLTNYIIRRKDVFGFALRDMFIYHLLKEMGSSTRQNHLENKVSVMARAELTAEYAGGMGFMKRLKEQIKSVDFEFSDLDSVCMPCNRKNGPSYGATQLNY